MDKTVKINSLLNQISQLDYDTRVYLIEKLAKLLRTDPNSKTVKKHNILELKGLGAEVWQDINIDEYIRQERDWD